MPSSAAIRSKAVASSCAIARVAKYNPQGIPEDAAKKLAPVFNLDQMAESYFQQDADPVKSSGIQSKKVSYKWRTVTKDDMKDFNDAWWQIVKANPQIALDALFANASDTQRDRPCHTCRWTTT